jgi:hypothetical protein
VAPARRLHRHPDAAVTRCEALRSIADGRRADRDAAARVDAHDAGTELRAHPDGAHAEADRGGPARHRDRPLPSEGGRVDARDGVVERVRDPERSVAVGDPRRARADGRFRDHRVRRRVDPEDASRRLVGHPDQAAADGDAAADRVRPDRVLDDLAGLGVDARHGAVVRVRDPDRAVAVGDSGGPCADMNLLDDRVRLGIDPGDRVVVVVCDPDAAAAHRDPARARPDCDRLDRLRDRIDARDGAGRGISGPDGAVARRDRRRRLVDRDLTGHVAAVRIDQADRIPGHERGVRTAAACRQDACGHRRGECDDCGGGDHSPSGNQASCEPASRIVLEIREGWRAR